MKTVLLCKDCIAALESRGEKVFIGSAVSRIDVDGDFKCEWCEDDYLWGDEPSDDDELYECIW